jgi:uncharacterized protein YjbI with pentapeptide repeats
MALSRSFRRTLGIASIAALLTAGLIAPPALAAAVPSNITVNCTTWSTTATTIKGAEGDTFTMTNTSLTDSCPIVANTVVSSAANLLPNFATTFTILAAGTFKVEDSMLVTHTFTVTLSTSTESSKAATYTMAFDANGGWCGAPELKKTGTDGARYNLPSEDCTREGYTLLGWAFSPTATKIADGNTTPAAEVRFSGTGTMYAVWAPANGYKEITYDSNVNENDECIDGSYFDTNPDSLLTSPALVGRTVVSLLAEGETLRIFPLCFPIYEGVGLRFVGWNTKADGTGDQYYAPSTVHPEPLFKLRGDTGEKVHLYAQWGNPCPTVDAETGAVAPPAFRAAQWAGCNLTGADLTDALMTDADLRGANLTDADLTGALLFGVISGRIITTLPPHLPTLKFRESDAGSSDGDGNWKLVNGYLVGPYANLTGADLTGADLSGADLSGANLSGATLDGVISGNRSKVQGEVLRGGIFVTLFSGPTLPDGWMLLNHYLVGPKAILTNAKLAGQDLNGADLSGANLNGADLTNVTSGDTPKGVNMYGAKLIGAELEGADLSGADLAQVITGDITGTPSELPANWILGNGFLIPVPF